MATSKTTIRRRRVRQQRVGVTTTWWERFRESVGLWPVFMVVVFATAVTCITLYGHQSLRYTVGQKITRPVLARVDFEWVNDSLTETNRKAASAAAPSHYRTNHKLIDDICLAVQTLYQDAKAAETYDAFVAAVQPKGWQVDEALFGDLRHLMDDQSSLTFAGWVERLGELLRERYTYRADNEVREPKATGLSVVAHRADPKQPEGPEAEPLELRVTRLTPISNPDLIGYLADDVARQAGFAPAKLQSAIKQLLFQRLSAEPLLLFDGPETEKAMAGAGAEVKPAVDVYRKGQPIVSLAQEGGELVLNEEHMARLQAEQHQYETLLGSDVPEAGPLREQVYLEQAGTAAIMVVLSVCLFLYIGMYQHRVLEVGMRTVALAGLLVAMLLAARGIDARFSQRELMLMPVLVVAACLAIAYPMRFAMGTMVIASLLLVVAIQGDVGLLITLTVGVSMTVILLDDIHSRTQIITAGLATAATVFVIVFAFGLIDRQGLVYTAQRGGYAVGAALAAALIVQGILPFIERLFRIATSLTLVEWSLADRPLLQRLAREAPGTYNHSLILGTIGEAACDAIGANGLLLRVGALYHDIGKIHKADYFAENQEASINRHDNLAASMSLLIILGHVKDGVELAREYGLPRVLYPFIEEHHGTTLVRYFHHKASEQRARKGKTERPVSEAEFRYPGPKPRSKETAVLMLCDGVEGAVRALGEPTAARIEGVVHKVVMDRLNDGQFSECDITLKELQKVEDSLVKSLCTFYHGRVAYPKEAPSKPANRGEDADEESDQSPDSGGGEAADRQRQRQRA